MLRKSEVFTGSKDPTLYTVKSTHEGVVTMSYARRRTFPVTSRETRSLKGSFDSAALALAHRNSAQDDKL
jgi:hypothetical protein